MVYKVFVSVFGEDCDQHGWHTNSMDYITEEEAKREGQSLSNRWTLVKYWKVREVAPGTYDDPDFKKIEPISTQDPKTVNPLAKIKEDSR